MGTAMDGPFSCDEWMGKAEKFAGIQDKLFDLKEETDADIDKAIRAVEKIDLQLSKSHDI